ncbi:P-loop containing nucleoside triphosphate hydrolases superfamily protein, partial [Perilla frutescens var. hirtella]
VDSLLGARGNDAYETSRLNEFMGAWDGLKSKESQRILVLGATNRPFDLDDAVLRRMPKRIYVGLPDVENRSKILKVLLNKDNLASRFSFEQLAEATQGYSGSDLKNVCIAAAYRPVQEFLQQESKGEGVAAGRPLYLNDFILSKAKVRASVAHNASSVMKLREWNEQYGEGEPETQT